MALFAVAALAAAFNPLNSTMVAVALPAIGEQFGSDPATLTTWLVNGFLLTTVICLAPAGKLADIWGHGRMLLAGQAILLIGIALVCTAPTLAVLVIGRILMAVATAILTPTGMALIRNNMPAERQPRAFGTLGAATSSAATVGPALAGFITDVWGWRFIFLVNLPLLLISWLCQGRYRLTGRMAPDRQRIRERFDWQGSLLLMATLLLLVIGMRLSGATAAALVAGGLVMAAAFVAWERRCAAPVVDFALFRRAGFAAGVAILSVQFFAMYGLIFQAPFLFTRVAGFGSTEVGMAIMVYSGAVIVCAPIAGRVAERVGPRPTICLGGLVGAAGIALLNNAAMWSSFSLVAVAFAVAGIGYGMSIGPAQAATLGAVGSEQSGAAAAALATLRYIGGIAGIAALTALLPDAPPNAVMGSHRTGVWLFAGAFALSSVIALFLPSGRPQRGA